MLSVKASFGAPAEKLPAERVALPRHQLQKIDLATVEFEQNGQYSSSSDMVSV